jgi:hypothetical protein
MLPKQMRRSRSIASNASTPKNSGTTPLHSSVHSPTTSASVTNGSSNYTPNEHNTNDNAATSPTKLQQPQHSTASELQVPLASAEPQDGSNSKTPPAQVSHPIGCIRQICDCQIDMEKESLGYNYKAAGRYQALKDSGNLPPGECPPTLPRIRARGEYYVDTFNDLPMTCTFGTSEEVSVTFHFSQYLILLKIPLT